MSAWLPIETAPANQEIIGLVGKRATTIKLSPHYVKFPHEEGGPTFKNVWIEITGDALLPCNPKGWMPLPSAQNNTEKTEDTLTQLTTARTEIAEQRSRADKAEAAAKSLKIALDMYANAWCRELGGKLFPKTHEIDALVKTTRWWQGRIEWAERIILGRMVYERFKEAFDALCPERNARTEIDRLLTLTSDLRDSVLEEAAAVVDYEFDRLWKEVYSRSGNAGVTKLRTQPLEVVAEQIRALKKTGAA